MQPLGSKQVGARSKSAREGDTVEVGTPGLPPGASSAGAWQLWGPSKRERVAGSPSSRAGKQGPAGGLAGCLFGSRRESKAAIWLLSLYVITHKQPAGPQGSGQAERTRD